MASIRLISFLIALMIITHCGCSQDKSVSPNLKENVNTVTVHLADRKQTIHNFGGSDAWACQFVGLWPDAKRNQIADWLFSTEDDSNGKPKGIGLSMWRFNIGAGSAVQNNIGDEWRSTEGFLTDTKTYDWSKQAGQQWFLQAAKQRGLSQFMGFSNSPPVQLTKNGKAFSSNGEQGNIDKINYAPFADFLVKVVKHFQEKGIPMNYLSPFNEPQWDWTGNGQEGTPYTNEQIYNITQKIDSTIAANHLSVKIYLGEAGKINYLFELADRPTRGNQIEDFFKKDSPHYVGGFSSVANVISGHSYFTSAPMDNMISTRKALAAKISAQSPPLEFWQSEYCILGDQEEIPGGGKDTGMTTALYVARLIHHDLTVANSCVWHWWTSLSVYDYKDGLIYADKNKTNGNIEDTKLLWALGNYSRFIRPGSVRVGVSSTSTDINNTKGLMVSSYLSEDGKKLITVAINYGNIDISTKLAVEGSTIQSLRPYLTGAGSDETLKCLPAVSSKEVILIPKKSIITLVAELSK